LPSIVEVTATAAGWAAEVITTIGFLYTGTFPKRVRKLVLVEGIGPLALKFSDAPPRMERWISEVNAVATKPIVAYSTLEEAATRLRRKNPRLTAEHALHLAYHGMKKTDNNQWIWKFDPLHRTTAPQPFYSDQAIEFFRRIECPTLIIRGRDSRQASRPDIQERLRAISHRFVVEISNAGHMVHHDNPEELAAAVTSFLAD
jgi:pimeloyl-ACP methyl ester carboxylesterase